MNKVVLSSIIDIISGGTPKTSVPEYWNGDIGWLSVTDFNNDNRFVYETEKTITERGVKESNTKFLQIGDIIISARGTVGALAQIGKPMCFNQSCFGIRGKKDKVANDYLFYALRNYVKNIVKRSQGSVFDTINLASFDLMELNIHTALPTQKSIAKVLSDLDAKIELNNKINRELEAMAKTLYNYWFVQFDFPNEEGKPHKSSGGKMVYNAELKREIPEGWVAGSFGDYCPSTGGFAFKSSWWTDKGVSVVKIKDIQEDYSIDISQLAKVDLSDKKVDDKFKAKPGDVLIAMTGATIGKYAIVPITDSPVYVNQRVGYFNLGSNPTKKLPYLINSLSQKYFREVVFSIAGGAAQPNISNEQINSIPLLIPDKSVIENYNQKFSSVYQTILNNQRHNQLLTALRDWLLPMLMNGQVTLKESEEKLSMAAEPSVKYGN
jgi:type I restriction enzyme S subunit